MKKEDIILGLLKEIKLESQCHREILNGQSKDISAIQEHLKNLNGSVARHEQKLNEMEHKTEDIKNNMTKWVAGGGLIGGIVAGAITVVVAIVQLFK